MIFFFFNGDSPHRMRRCKRQVISCLGNRRRASVRRSRKHLRGLIFNSRRQQQPACRLNRWRRISIDRIVKLRSDDTKSTRHYVAMVFAFVVKMRASLALGNNKKRCKAPRQQPRNAPMFTHPHHRYVTRPPTQFWQDDWKCRPNFGIFFFIRANGVCCMRPVLLRKK